MQLGDHLGFAGIILGLVGLGLTFLWPTKRWIGYVAIGLAVICGLKWGMLTCNEAHENVSEAPFSVDIEGTFMKAVPGGPGPFARGILNPPQRLVSIDYMPGIRITNRQSIEATIKSYSLELRDKEGRWQRLIKVPVSPTAPDLFFLSPDLYLTTMTPESSLDTALSGKALAPGGSVDGWAYFAFPESFDGLPEKIEERITVSDFSGHQITVPIETKPNSQEIIPGNHSSFKLGDNKLDINSYSFTRITQPTPQ
jgi:hypothetical protein